MGRGRAVRVAPTMGVTVSLFGLLAILAAWEILSLAIHTYTLFPTVQATVMALWRSFASDVFPIAIGQTVARVVVAFVLGSILGAMIGLAMGSFSIVRRALQPYVHFFRFVTPIAFVSPAAVWFGVGSPSVVFLIFYATVFLVLVNTMDGVLHVRPQRIRMAECFGAPQRRVISRVIAPSIAPFIFSGMRIAMSNSFTTAIGTEMLTGTDGIGNLVYKAYAFYEGDVMFAGIIVIGLLGFLLDRLFLAIQKSFFGRYVRVQ